MTTTLSVSPFQLMTSDPLHTLLHAFKMVLVWDALTQTQGHHPAGIFPIHNILELVLVHSRCVLSPEEVGLYICLAILITMNRLGHLYAQNQLLLSREIYLKLTQLLRK